MDKNAKKALKKFYKYLNSTGYKIVVADGKKSGGAIRRVMAKIQNKQKQEMELENEK